MNNSNIAKQFTIWVITFIVGLLVWRYYKEKTFPLEKRYSTFGPRFWTGSVDSCVMAPLSFLTFLLLIPNIPRTVAAVIVIIQESSWLVYTVTMHGRYGQTIGKMVTKVRVVDFRTEGKITWTQAWLREGIPILISVGFVGYEIYLILSGTVPVRAVATGELSTDNAAYWLVSGMPGIWFLAEVLTMLTNKKRRALHDIIAGTVVVRTNIDYRTVSKELGPSAGATEVKLASAG